MKKLILTVVFVFPHAAMALTPLRIDFIEALSLKDTTSSERFQKDYEGAIQIAKSMLASKLEKCGYSLDTKTAFFDSSDALKAKELSSQAEAGGSWLVVGPRRSNHYLLLAQGVSRIPTVSLMASSDGVSKLGTRHVSVSPTNTQMAEAAAKETVARMGRQATYVSVVSDDCANCVDFARAFDKAAIAVGLRKLDEIKIVGESFKPEEIRRSVELKRPKVVLLPNYSNVSSSIMSAFNYAANPPLFVGGDGWGDSRYGFVQNGQQVENVRGLTVRGFPPVETELKAFALGKEVLRTKKELPFSAANIAILKVVDSISDLMCSSKPKDKAAFTAAFEKRAARALQAPWGVSVYDLKNGQIEFTKTKVTKR